MDDKETPPRTPEVVFREFEEDTHSRWYERAAKTHESIVLLKDAGREQERQQAIWEHALTLLDSGSSRLPVGRAESRFASKALLIDGKEVSYEQILSEDALVLLLKKGRPD